MSKWYGDWPKQLGSGRPGMTRRDLMRHCSQWIYIFFGNRGILGRNKIQDRWVAIPYRVEQRMSPNSLLYRVHRFDGLGQARVVRRSAILDIKNMRVLNENTAKAPEQREQFWKHETDGHGE